MQMIRMCVFVCGYMCINICVCSYWMFTVSSYLMVPGWRSDFSINLWSVFSPHCLALTTVRGTCGRLRLQACEIQAS